MIRTVLATKDHAPTTILRLILGIVFFAHGSQLVMGWFGGFGLHAALAFFTKTLGIPAALALLAIFTQFFGGMALILGFFTRLAAIGIAANMIVAVMMVHLHFGFFMNWFGRQKGEGYEFHLVIIAIATYLLIEGGGAFSVDRLLLYPEMPRSIA